MTDQTDLHLHSNCSDGVLPPSQLVALVAQAGIKRFALTDHDTTAGLDEAATAAGLLGLTAISGIELSAAWHGRTIHVVGLNIDPCAPLLCACIQQLQRLRQQRILEITRRLDRLGAPGQAVQMQLSALNVPTRTHVARALVELGAITSVASAFDRWLGDGKSAYVAAEWPDLAQIVAGIISAGGTAVIAHPLRYRLSAGQRRQLLAEFKTAGGTGLEIVSGNHAPHQIETALGLALRAGLDGSVGSDCHDPAIPWHRLGRLAKLPASVTPVWRRWSQELA
jgi:hypothetical protein